MSQFKAQRCDDAEDASQLTAATITKMLEAAISARGEAHLACSGGNTPDRTYEILSDLLGNGDGVHLWLADERCVGPEDPQANSLLLQQTLKLPGATLHRVKGELGPDAAAADYCEQIGDTQLDVVLLGLGPDGHTASLFPDHPELEMTGARVIPVVNSPKPPPERVSLSLPTLSGVTDIVLLVTGAGKADALALTLGEPGPQAPASLLPADRMTLIADAAALGESDS
jgi:6-phosphogluconolactonase